MMKNALAYNGTEQITEVKIFMMQLLGANVIKL
jgi:hypothetical protein